MASWIFGGNIRHSSQRGVDRGRRGMGEYGRSRVWVHSLGDEDMSLGAESVSSLLERLRKALSDHSELFRDSHRTPEDTRRVNDEIGRCRRECERYLLASGWIPETPYYGNETVIRAMEDAVTANYTVRSHSDPRLPWCARIQRDGYLPVIFGTVSLPPDTVQSEIESTMLSAMEEVGVGDFRILELLPGAMVWVPR